MDVSTDASTGLPAPYRSRLCLLVSSNSQPAYTVTVRPQTAQVVLMPKRLEAMAMAIAVEHISQGV
jgi:hypothetical protein